MEFQSWLYCIANAGSYRYRVYRNTKEKSRRHCSRLKTDGSNTSINQEMSNRSPTFQQSPAIYFLIVPTISIRYPWILHPSNHPIHPGLIVSRAQHAYNRSLPIITAYRSLEACPRSVPTVQSCSPFRLSSPRSAVEQAEVYVPDNRAHSTCVFTEERSLIYRYMRLLFVLL